MKKYFSSNGLVILVLFLIAAAVSVMIYPELFLKFKISPVLWSDYCVEYPLNFILTTFFYQGGLQLWNMFGQMPYYHTYAVEGLFKFPNVVTSIAYYLTAPFLGYTSQLFEHLFIWVNLMTLLFLRVVGIYLLLKTVTKKQWLLMVATVIFAVFFSQLAFIRGTCYMSYFPLGIYFIVRFFQGLQLRYLLASLAFLVVGLGNGILHGAYMYLPFHFFILAGIIWRCFLNPSPRPNSDINLRDYSQWRKIVLVVLAAFFILLPFACIVKYGFHEVAFGQANSRISHMFSPQWYLHNPDLELGSPPHFFADILNMQTIDVMFYVGIVFLFLSLTGLILGRHPLKWFFAIGIFWLWLLSFPRSGVNIGLLAHWINILTNPLKTIPRSYLYACQPMLPFLLMPLAVMGFEVIEELCQGKKFKGSLVGLLGLSMLLLLANALPIVPTEVGIYLVVVTAFLLMGLAFVQMKGSTASRNLLMGSVCVFFLVDIFMMVHQIKTQLYKYEDRPRILDAAPQTGMVSYTAENPSIFPYRYSYSFNFSYRDELYIWFPHIVSTDVHHVINPALNFTYLNGYNPRDAEFENWSNDREMFDYLNQNDQFIFLASSAVNASAGTLGRINTAGLAHQVIEVQDLQGKLNLPDQWSRLPSRPSNDIQYEKIIGSLDDNNDYWWLYHQQGNMIIYTMRLPDDFPEHLASSWFPSEQKYLRFLVERSQGKWQEFQGAQGRLIVPYTFDVQNMKRGELNAAFPLNDFPMHQQCVLLYPSKANEGVERVWLRQFDNLGIIYRARISGWLVIHEPYDPKWKITVDGNVVDYYRVNKSFIGFPLAAGEHKILIQYWPHSPLRFLLLVSVILTTLGMIVLIFLGMRWEAN